MKKWISIFLCSILGFSCGKSASKSSRQQGIVSPQPTEYTDQSNKNQSDRENSAPYQVGDQFQRKNINFSKSFEDLDNKYNSVLKTIVRVGNATGIFLGIEGDQAIVLTSKHTVPSQRKCDHGLGLHFPFLSELKKFPCKKLISSWTEIDSALVLFGGFSPEEINFLRHHVESNHFSSYQDEIFAKNKRFVTAGYGRFQNPNQELTLNSDADCRWLGDNATYSKHRDPDTLNPLPYLVWSVPSGCDISHGDSGSPLIHTEDGKIYGIFWSGKMPKSKKVQSSEYLLKWAPTAFENLYQELNLVVPSSSIQNVIKNNLSGDSCLAWECEKTTQIVQKALKLF